MHETILKLLATLDQQTACYQEMEKVLAEEEASMSLTTKERFEQVQLEKEDLVFKLQQFEADRKPLVDQLSGAYALDGKVLKVSQLAHFLSPPYDQSLLERADRLRSTVSAVQEKNSRNQLLINQYLDLINGSLKLLTDLMDDDPVYRQNGAIQYPIGYRYGGGRIICGSV